MPDLSRLIYISTSAIEGADPFDKVIRRLLLASRRLNERNRITGALMCGAGHFAQVLEGPATAVEETFGRIKRDPRHREIDVIHTAPAEERMFPGWAMAYSDRPDRADIFLQRIRAPLGSEAQVLLGRLRVFVLGSP